MSTPHTAQVEFLPLAEAYLDEIMDTELEAYPEPWSRSMFLEEIRNNRSYFYVMLLEGSLAGYGGFWLVLDEAHITSVTVVKRFRGQGLGRRLTLHLLEVARRAGARTATLEVRESNRKAQNLYETLGFRQIARRRGYYPKSGEDALVMLLELDQSTLDGADAGGQSRS